MTLKELCEHFRNNQYDVDMCEYYKNQYMLDNKDKYGYERLDEHDIDGLRPYLMCWALALYEYLANYNNIEVEDWFSKYDGVVCKKDENDYCVAFLELYEIIHSTEDSEPASRLYDGMVSNSVPEFRRRGIAMYALYNIA